MSNDLQLFSFVLEEESIDDIELFAFKLPNEVYEVINEIGKGKDKKEYNAYRTIYKVATTLFDKVIYCNNRLYDIEKDNYRWVYTLEKIDLDLIKLKITEWLKKEVSLRCEAPIIIDFKEEWEYDSIFLKEIFNSKRGSKYSIIPNYYIYKLCQKDYDLNCIEKTLKFYRVMGEESAQMITLPVKLEKKKYNSFSYAISMLMKDPIDMPCSVLNISISVKVWEDRNVIDEEKGKSYIPGKESTSIYLYKENPYYYDKDIIFNKISIKRKNEDNFIFDNTCDEQYCDILDIDVLNILKNTKKYQMKDKEVIGLIGKKYQVGMLTQYGAGLPERTEMLKLVCNYLSKFELRKPIKFLVNNGNNKEINLSKDQLNIYGFDEYIVSETGKSLPKEAYKLYNENKEIIIILATKNENLMQKVTATIRILLRLDNNIEDNIYTNNDNLKVQFKYIDNTFALHLNENENETNAERINKIKEVFDKEDPNKLKGIIVDIEPYHNIKAYKKIDSKNVVRNGLRRSGIISQFINYVDESDDKKEYTKIDTILSTAKDLISALGFQESSLYSNELKNNDILIGINKLSTSNYDTRLVMSKIKNGNMYYKMYPEKIWIESTKYLCNLNNSLIQNSKIKSDNKSRIGFENWIKDCLAEALQSGKKVYCFVNCVLRGGIWSYIKNNEFNKFETLDIPSKENLRIIRINDTDEIPQYYIYDGNDNINSKTGIFKSERNTYYLVGSKHDGNKVAKYTTKCSNPAKPIKKPTLYEINIQGSSSEEEADSIAKLTQKLRNMNISYKKESSAPLPLYCILRISEYIKAELDAK